MLQAGDKAPAFTLPDQNDDQVKPSDLKGQTVVLYFYPRADTMSYNCSNGHAGRHRHHPSL
jgi:peroxiredoxin Q/BCP